MKSLPPINKRFFWILLALIVKFGMFAWRVLVDHPGDMVYHGDSFALAGGDTEGYLKPIENFMATGRYFDDFRMPGYGFPYVILRLFLDEHMALNTLVVLQFILSAISVYYLGLICWYLTGSVKAFYIGFFTYLVSSFVTLWDVYLLTESFSTSALIFSCYLLMRPGNRLSNYLFAGLFAAWLFFMKPVLIPLLLMFLLIIVARAMGRLRIKIIFFLLPFTILEIFWIARNFIVHERFVPLQQATYGNMRVNTYHRELHLFVKSFGGSTAQWEPDAEIGFFIPGKVPGYENPVVLPERIYTSAFNKDSLEKIRDLISHYHSTENSLTREHLNRTLINSLSQYRLSLKREKPWFYYFGSTFTGVNSYLFNSPTYYLFHLPWEKLSVPAKLVKGFYTLIYFLVLITGFAGMCGMIFYGLRRKKYELPGLALMGAYILIVFPLVFRMVEPRFFVPAYPLFIVYATWFISFLRSGNSVSFVKKGK